MPKPRLTPDPGSYIDRAVKTSREPGSVIWNALIDGRGPLHPAIWIVKDTVRGRDVIESRGSGAAVAHPPR